MTSLLSTVLRQQCARCSSSASTSLKKSGLGTGFHKQSFHASSTILKASSRPQREFEKSAEDEDAGPEQPFVTSKIQAGEWDPLHFENPLYRPQYKPRSKLLSREDYQKRPEVGFHGVHDSMADAQVVLTWITHDQQRLVYEAYKEMLRVGYEKYGVTSHEYVVRTIAQKFHISAHRCAGIIQLQSNEEEYREQGIQLNDDAAAYVDSCALQEIEQCYKAHGMKQPTEIMFWEEPAHRNAQGKSKKLKTVDDLIDVDEMWKAYKEKHLPQKANRILSKYRFIEDIDDDKVPTPVNKETMRFITKYDEMVKQQKEETEARDEPDFVKEARENGDKNVRRRWKYVAQMVNRRELRKIKEKQQSKPNYTYKNKNRKGLPTTYSNQSMENTLVNEGGTLRPATLDDIKNVSWKPKRHQMGRTDSLEEQTAVMEFTYRKAKLKWLDKINGREKVKPKLAETKALEAESETEEEESAETEEGEDTETLDEAAAEEVDKSREDEEESKDK